MPEQMTLAPASAGVKAVGLAGEWKAKKGAAKQELPAMPGGAALNAHATPTLLYQGMVRAIAPFTPRGVIWYQGESNRDAAMQYRSLFPAVIEDWRATFKRPEMPFLFVQLAPFRYGGDKGETALVREAQARTLGVANTGMAVTMDVGNASDIHPKNKQEVGRRLALWALAKTYGKGEIVHSGPLFKSVAFEGDKARVRFEHTGTGLVARGGDLKTFLIAGEDKVFYPGVAKREGDTIMVHSPRVSKPAAVRYGWDDDCEPNLFNKEGLPASPFRSDEWKLEECALNLSAAMESLRTKEAGFKDLFDGKSLAGWVNINTAPSTWSVGKDEEGGATIRCTGIPTGVMRTEAVYENFVAELEWRHLVAGGNAGFFVWSDALTSAGVPFTRSVEVQVMDGQEGPGYTSDGDVFPIHGATMTPENGRGGQRAFPTERRMNASPNWNHYRVTCQDGTISVAVNGKVVTRGRNISPRKGHICLESEGSAIDFRNIRIKELPSAPSLAPEQVARVSENGGAWTSLYTGVDFAGWKYKASYEGHWVASDWTIHYDGKAGEDLWSEKSYKDFEMIVDWRFPGKAKELEHPVILSDGNTKKGPDGKDVMEKVQDAGDSGIYLRGSSKSQVNIWCWGIGSGEVYGYRTDGAMSAQVRAGVTPRSRADKPIGEWNRFHITMKGERLSVVLNGTKVLDEAHLPGVAPEGPIALQHHGDEVEFANLFIRELK
jgi:hypothetical protein